jgi:hypothetical protein
MRKLTLWGFCEEVKGAEASVRKRLVLTYSCVVLVSVADAPQHARCAGSECKRQRALLSFV